MNIYERFLSHLEICGGCTGQRAYNLIHGCKYAMVCEYVENLASKGEITNSQDIIFTGPVFSDIRSKSNTKTNSSTGKDSHIRRGSYADYNKEFATDRGPCTAEDS